MKKLSETFRHLVKINEISNTFEFHPCIDITEVENFETKFNITLPEVYKYVITKLFNGISYKEHNSLKIIEKLELDNAFFRQDEYVWTEFPLEKRIYFGYPNEDLNKSEEGGYPYETEYINETNPYTKGSIIYSKIDFLSTGCDCYYFLVINGKEKGNVWCSNVDSNNEIVPEYDRNGNGTRLTFKDWLLSELEMLIKNENKTIANNVYGS